MDSRNMISPLRGYIDGNTTHESFCLIHVNSWTRCASSSTNVTGIDTRLSLSAAIPTLESTATIQMSWIWESQVRATYMVCAICVGPAMSTGKVWIRITLHSASILYPSAISSHWSYSHSASNRIILDPTLCAWGYHNSDYYFRL